MNSFVSLQIVIPILVRSAEVEAIDANTHEALNAFIAFEWPIHQGQAVGKGVPQVGSAEIHACDSLSDD